MSNAPSLKTCGRIARLSRYGPRPTALADHAAAAGQRTEQHLQNGQAQQDDQRPAPAIRQIVQQAEQRGPQRRQQIADGLRHTRQQRRLMMMLAA